MNLLVFSPYYPPHVGGLESHSDEFNKYLSQKGTRITVFTPRLPAAAPKEETIHAGVDILRFPAFELFHNYPVPKFWTSEFWEMWQGLPESKLVISRTRFFFTSLMAWRLARMRRIPWVHIEHGSDYAQFRNPLKHALGKLYDQTVGRLVLRFADTTVANSRASSSFVCGLARKNVCHVIYRGVEKEAILVAPEIKDIRDRHPDQLIIGYIGRLIEGKGVADLLRALSLISRKNFHCAIIGAGPEKKSLERLTESLGLVGKISFLGYKPFAESIGLMKSFDIFVNPSHTEGIPTAVIEAALCAKAIVATDVGGTREIISGQGDGYLVTPRNTGELTEKLDELLKDASLRKQFGERARQAVEMKFSWEESAETYLSLFRKILKR